jgi:tetratricopeptide (TPR) repeat protein
MLADSVRIELEQAVDEAKTRLKDLTLSGPARLYTGTLLRYFRLRDYQHVLSAIESHQRDIRAIVRVLAELHTRVSRAESLSAELDPLGSAWWNLRRRDLIAARQRGGADWEQLWTRTWAEAFAAERFDLCADVVALGPEDGPAQKSTERMRTAAKAAADGDFGPAAQVLTTILYSPDPDLLDRTTTVRLAVLLARIHLRGTRDLEAAERAARTARDAGFGGSGGSPPPAVRALAVAAQGEIALAHNDGAQAQRAFQEAISIFPELPDPHIGAALVAERDEAWYRAEECYDAAIDKAGAEVTKRRLLRPVPGNLLWRYARTIQSTDPEQALALVDEAMNAGITGDGPYPHSGAVADKARILAELNRPVDAAEAYNEAGNLFASTGADERALVCFEQAQTLDPTSAEYSWGYGEALRASAIGRDDIIDIDTMRRAWTATTAGFTLAAPDPPAPWALVTAALIADQLPETGESPLVLAERALLLDRTYARGYAHLSVLLRTDGWSADAFDAAHQGYDLDPDDSFVVYQYATVLMDQSRYARALEVLDEHLARRPESTDLLYPRVLALLNLRDPQAAIDALVDAPTTEPDVNDVLLAVCYLGVNNTRKAMRHFERVWKRRDATTSRYLLSYAAYATGRFDDNFEILEGLERQVRDKATVSRDTGLALLARGAPEDLERGEERLTAGIRAAMIASDLLNLVNLEFPLLQQLVAGAPHAAGVAGIITAATRLCHDHVAAILSRAQAADTLPSALARARTGLDEGNLDEAFRIYADMARSDALPEAHHGLARASRMLVKQGDDLVRTQAVMPARTIWSELLPRLEKLIPDSEVVTELRTRLAFAAQELEGQPAATALIRAVLVTVTDDDPDPFAAAAKVFVRDVESYWSHRDALLAHATDETLAPAGRRRLARLADGLDLAAVCRVRRADIDPAAVFPLPTQIEVRLGEDVARDAGYPDLTQSLNQLRDRLEAETGVHVPGIRTTVGRPSDPRSVELCVVEQIVYKGRPMLAEAPAAHLTGWVVEQLEAALRLSLARLLGIDDVPLWLEGWDRSGHRDDNGVRDDELVRLRLVRVLRLLLREGIPIRDRAAIIDGFRAAERSGASGPLEALQEVRRRLGPAVLDGAWTHAPVPLDADLEARVAAGIPAGHPSVWELPRAEAEGLVDDLVGWRDAHTADGPISVVVRNAGIRPFVWRLLAAGRTPVRVLADEELEQEPS